MSETNPTEAGRIALPGHLNVPACLAAVAGVLLPVVVQAVQEAVKDPEVQARLAEAGKLLFRPQEG